MFCIFVEAGDSIFIGNSRLGCYVCLTAVFSHYYYDLIVIYMCMCMLRPMNIVMKMYK